MTRSKRSTPRSVRGRRRTRPRASTAPVRGEALSRLPDRVRIRPPAAPPRSKPEGIQVAGIPLTNPDRVFFPDPGLTKLELAGYYESIAERMVPHVADRPLTLIRCPNGYAGQCFFQKHALEGWPDAIGEVRIREGRGTGKEKATYLRVHDAAGLVALAQMSVLEIHVWGSRADRLEYPDRMVFDLDPDPSVPWKRVVDTAHHIRRRLRELDLESWVKTTGGKGIHVVAPLDRSADWNEVLEGSRALAQSLERDDPEGITINMSKARRKNKIFVDIFRNGRGATWIAPYSTRARPGAPISTPLFWEELTVRMPPDRFTVRNLTRRLATQRKDPWADIGRARQSLPASLLKALRSGARR